MADQSINLLLRRLDHLTSEFHELREGVQKAVRISDDDPEMALTRARKVLEYVVRDVFELRCKEPAGTRPLENLLQRLIKDGHLTKRLGAYATYIRDLGNVGTHAHGEDVTKEDVRRSFENLTTILEWYFERVRPEAFAKAEDPAAEEAEVRRLAEEEAARRRAEGERRARKEDELRRRETAAATEEQRPRGLAHRRPVEELEREKREDEEAKNRLSGGAGRQRKVSRRMLAAIAASVLLLLTVGGGWWLLSKGRDQPADDTEAAGEGIGAAGDRGAQSDTTARETEAARRAAETVRNRIGMEFVYVPPGSFMRGSTNGPDEEKPVRQVTIREGFYMGKYEVTQAQWQAVMGNNPSNFKGDNLPVENISWNGAQEFISRLTARNDGYTYRLPSEAEWEYAARAGTTGEYAGDLDAAAWYRMNSGERTHPVGQKQPNDFELYDMHGNVWEWCADNYHNSYNGAPTDGSAWVGGNSKRVIRGGGWSEEAVVLRFADRFGAAPSASSKSLGFRVIAIARK